jgi:hypothetical protein
VDFLETADQFIGKKRQNVFQVYCSIIAMGADQIQRFPYFFRERRLVWRYVSLVHCFQHGVFAYLQNITVLSADGHMISAGLKTVPES